jgi:DNA helicase-2/ATP-dependent DNA helicase PcrA
VVESSRCFRLLDWDQTIPLAGRLLHQLDEVPEWLSKIKHYFVDEYQDFNRAEQGLISHLASTADSIVIVGDDDQSLYSGRGGSPDGIRSLYAAPENDQVTLVKCYRCKANIVTPTNSFQAHMSATPRPMIAAASGGQVLCYRFKSSKAEVAFLTEFLNARLAELPDTPTPRDGIICLFPSRRILTAYYEMLSPHVACARRGRDTPDNRLWLERVLSLLVRRGQRFLERLLLNAYTRLKPRHRAMIVQRVIERDISPAEACASLIAEAAFTGAAASAAKAFVDFCTSLAECDLPLVGRIVSTTLSLDEAAVVAEIEKLMDADPSERSELIESTCDSLLPNSVAPEPDPRAAMFLTMHGSKGLTRKTVVLPGLEEACLPDGGDPTALPEKQRLFFVALSRAADSLVLTLPHNRGGADSLNFPMPGRGDPSTFIAAAGLGAQYHP